MHFQVSTEEQRTRGSRTSRRNQGHADGIAGVKARSQDPEYLAAFRLGVKERTSSLSEHTCARPECRKKLPELAVKHEDPYCSTQCCRIERGLNPSNAAPAGIAGTDDDDDVDVELDDEGGE